MTSKRKQGDAPEKTAMRNGLHQHVLAHLVARDRPFALGQGPASPAGDLHHLQIRQLQMAVGYSV